MRVYIVAAEQLLTEIASCLEPLRQPGVDDAFDPDEIADMSLLDLDSEMPLTFALDLQMLPTQSHAKAEGSCAALIRFVLGM